MNIKLKNVFYKKTIILIMLVTIFPSISSVIAKNNHSYSYKSYKPKPYIAQNGSYYGQYSRKTYRPKNVYVDNYIRNDGSRVRSHYRSKKK